MKTVNIFSGEKLEHRLDVARVVGSAATERVAGADADVLELASVGGLRLSGQRQDRGVARDEENELIFRRSTAVPWSDGEEGWDKAF